MERPTSKSMPNMAIGSSRNDSVARAQASLGRHQRSTWLLLGTAIACSLGLFIVGTHYAGIPTRVSQVAPTTLPAKAEKPPLTKAEETYIQALWPIHGEVERVTSRRSLGIIFYKANEIDKADLQARIEFALKSYQSAETYIRALDVPEALAQAHREYLAAIQMLEQSALESLKMFEDGREDHLLTAYPMVKKATDTVRELGGRFWRDEFPPN